MPHAKTRRHREFSSSSSPVAVLDERRQRKASRQFVRLPASIRLHSSPQDEHVAFVRDISPTGVFFYSDFKPTAGERQAFVLQYQNGPKKETVHFAGSVVRIEQATSTSATGIAVQFDREHEQVPHVPARRGWFLNVRSAIAKPAKPSNIREVFIHERGTHIRRFMQECLANQVPKIGAKLSLENRKFVVMDKENLLLKRDKRAVRAVLLIVEDLDALSW